VADLAIITPSRGRPDRFAELVASVAATAAGDVQVWVGLDDDDPADYHDACNDPPGNVQVVAFLGERRSLSGWTNHLAGEALASIDPPRYLASLGDDHRPRTPGWDRTLIAAIEGLDGPGFAYGNDLFQGAAVPTAWVASAVAVRAVGWMMPPTCAHMFVDNAVLELGRAAGRIVYRPDVVIEHLHPVAGKAHWDDSYRASNHPDRYAADKAAFEVWLRDGLDADAARVRAVTYAKAAR
jgi:hypothetical protein